MNFNIQLDENYDNTKPIQIHWAFSIPSFDFQINDYQLNDNNLIFDIDTSELPIGFYIIVRISQDDFEKVLYREYHLIN